MFRQAFIVDIKFEVVGEETSSLASFRKLLTFILSGIMTGFGRVSIRIAHVADICEMIMSTARRNRPIESFRRITRSVQVPAK